MNNEDRTPPFRLQQRVWVEVTNQRGRVSGLFAPPHPGASWKVMVHIDGEDEHYREFCAHSLRGIP